MTHSIRCSSLGSSLAVGCLALIVASSLNAQEWPQWRGANRDARAAQFTAPATWPAQLTQKWKVPVGSGDATPALVGEKLYVFSLLDGNEVTLCLNAGDGKTLWQDKHSPNVTVSGPSARQHPGPRSSPAVAEGKVVTLGVGGVLSCLDADSGKPVWRKEFSQQFRTNWPSFYTALSPMIVDGLAIAHVGGQGKGALLAFDLKSGDQKWAWEGDAPAYASPALMTVDGVKMIVDESEKSIAGVGIDGKLLWQIPFQARGRMSYNAASPIIDGQTIIYSGADRGTKAAAIERTGDAYSTKELWSADIGTQFNTPVLNDGRLYGISGAGNFFCLDAKTGKLLWTDKTRHGRGFGSIVDAGSVLLALTPQSELLVLRPSDKEFDEIAHIKVASTETYAYPIVSGNRIFIRDQNDVTCFAVP